MADQAKDTDTSVADAQAAAVPSVSNFDQELLAAFHSAPENVKRGLCLILRMESAGGEAQAQFPTVGKRKHESETDEQSRTKKARTSVMPSETDPIDFRSVTSPEVPIYCMIQVNGGPPIGMLDTCEADYSIRMILCSEKGRSPSIGLRFRHPGSKGRKVGRVDWRVDSRAEDRWIVQDLEYVLVTEAPHDKAINHATVIGQCEGAGSLGRLMCITLKLTSHAGGNCERPAEDLSTAIKTCINAIFWHEKDYTLRIWFLKPWSSRPDLDIRPRPIAARRTGPAARLSPAKRPTLDLKDGGFREEEEHAAASDKSAEESEAKEKAEFSLPSRPARGLFSE